MEDVISVRRARIAALILIGLLSPLVWAFAAALPDREAVAADLARHGRVEASRLAVEVCAPGVVFTDPLCARAVEAERRRRSRATADAFLLMAAAAG